MARLNYLIRYNRHFLDGPLAGSVIPTELELPVRDAYQLLAWLRAGTEGKPVGIIGTRVWYSGIQVRRLSTNVTC